MNKVVRTFVTSLCVAASVSSVVAGSYAHASPGGQSPKAPIEAGDYAVVTYRLSNFHPNELVTKEAKTIAKQLADSELSRLTVQNVLLSKALETAQRDAEYKSSLNPLLRSRGTKAAQKVSEIAGDLARITIQKQRMDILKKAIRGEALTELETERVRLHEFKTLRSVANPSDVSNIAARAIQKESAAFGARVTAIEKFAAPQISKAFALQAKTKLKIAGSIGVAVGVAVFVLYSDYEIERTEGELGQAVEVAAPLSK